MSFIFDSSSIFEALLRKELRLLSGNYTINLAKYELGSLVWKRGAIIGDIALERQVKLLGLAMGAIKLMQIADMEGHEESILNLANELKMPFYDSSYVYAARILGLPLVTEDKELRKKAIGKIETLGIRQLEKR